MAKNDWDQRLLTGIFQSNEDLVIEALNNGANPNKENKHLHTAVVEAIIKGNVNILYHLIRKGGDINECRRSLKTPLSWASYHGKVGVVICLISNGACFNLPEKNTSWIATTYAGHTKDGSLKLDALLRAAQSGKLEEVRRLVDSSTTVQGISSMEYVDFSIPLMMAAREGHFDIVKCLVGNKADVNKQGEPLANASKRGHLDIVKYLISAGAQINRPDHLGYTPLANAVFSSNLNLVKYFVEADADVCKSTYQGKAPLDVAACTENLEIVEYLLKQDTEPTVQMAFSSAVGTGSLEIVKALIRKGAQINFVYDDGATPLYISIDHGKSKVARFLIDSGANTDAFVKNPIKSVMVKSVEGKNWEMLTLLLELGLNADECGDDGCTPLTKAVHIEEFKIVKYLLTNGAPINLADGKNTVALAVAATNQFFRIAKYLIDSGADVRLAQKEVEKFAAANKNFAIYLKSLNKTSVSGSGHEAAV